MIFVFEGFRIGRQVGVLLMVGFFNLIFFYSLFSLPSPPPNLSLSPEFVRSGNPDGSEVPKMEDALLCLHRGSGSSARLTNTTLKRLLFL